LFLEKFNVRSLSNLPIIFLLNIGPKISELVGCIKIILFLGALKILDF